MTVEMTETTTIDQDTRVSFIWLEITGKCQLGCEHCYADSGPTGSHGTMTGADWMRVIDEAAELGVEMVQFIGGEPTLHPDLGVLVRHALTRGLKVEVYTNLVRVTPEQWVLFELPGVRLATSYYSDEPAEHDSITGRNRSHGRTLANIAEAVQRRIQLRVGLVDVRDEQRVSEACEQLTQAGVEDIGIDRLRGVGRGVDGVEPNVAELCGNCGHGVMAVGPDGSVWPCVFSRWMSVGNVGESSLASILDGPSAMSARRELATSFAQRQPGIAGQCNPNCLPQTCQPQCGPNRQAAGECNPNCLPQTCQPQCGPNRTGRATVRVRSVDRSRGSHG